MPSPLIDPSIDAPALFDRTAEVFAGTFEPRRIVAASAERALFVVRDVVLQRDVALRIHLEPQDPSRPPGARCSSTRAPAVHCRNCRCS